MTDSANLKPSITTIVMEEVSNLIAIQDRWLDNLNRLRRIVYVNMHLDPEKIIVEGEFNEMDLIEYLNDIHRAIIVFSHSTIEVSICDTVEYLLKLRYSYDPVRVLEFLDQRKKFSIEEMKNAGDKTADQMIQEYATGKETLIDGFIDNRSFNQEKDVTTQLKAIGINPQSMHKHLESLDEMMNRRHRIAHKFDYTEIGGQKRLNHIEFGVVRKWTDHLMDFLQSLLKEVLLSDWLATDLQGKAKNIGITASTEEIKALIRGVLHTSRLEIPWSETK